MTPPSKPTPRPVLLLLLLLLLLLFILLLLALSVTADPAHAILYYRARQCSFRRNFLLPFFCHHHATIVVTDDQPSFATTPPRPKKSRPLYTRARTRGYYVPPVIRISHIFPCIVMYPPIYIYILLLLHKRV